MIHTPHLRDYVVSPALHLLGQWSEAAERLVLGTIAQESKGGRYLRQLGQGPALGIAQMEPKTHDDLWANYLHYRPLLQGPLLEMAGGPIEAELLVYNLRYAAAMCRVHYLRVPRPLPRADDIHGLARYWKAHYNTERGKGTVEQFIRSWQLYVADTLEARP